MKLLLVGLVLCGRVSANPAIVSNDIASSMVNSGRINRRSPLNSQPAQIQIDYHIASIGDHGIELTMNNYDKRAAYILTWNTIFEVPMPATRSISVIPINQGLSAPDRYLSNVHIDHRKVLASSFLKIPPVDDEGRGVQWYFDLRDDFFIRQGGSYQVKVQQQFRGFLAEDWDFQRLFEGSGLLARSDIADLPLLTPLEVDLVMNLRASMDGTAPSGSAAPIDSRNVPITKCAWDQGWKVSDARAGANQLAQVAGHLKDDTVWTQYYNGPQAIRDALDRAYANIESYRQESRTFGVLERCPTATETLTVTARFNADKRVPWCTPDRATFLVQYQGSTESILGFCDLFFSFPELRKCDSPSLANNNMVDQTGVLLRALSGVSIIANDARVLNGDPGNDYCYGWGCVTNAARFRPSPRWDNTPPAAEALAFRYGKPEDIPDAFEQYAYALRAKTCTDKDRKRGTSAYCKIRDGCRAGALCLKKALRNADVLLGTPIDSVGTCSSGS